MNSVNSKKKLMLLALVLLVVTPGIVTYLILAMALPQAPSSSQLDAQESSTQTTTEDLARQADQSKKDGEEALSQRNFDKATAKFDEAKKLYSEAGNVVASEQMKDMLSVAKIEADMAETNTMQPGPTIDAPQEPQQ